MRRSTEPGRRQPAADFLLTISEGLAEVSRAFRGELRLFIGGRVLDDGPLQRERPANDPGSEKAPPAPTWAIRQSAGPACLAARASKCSIRRRRPQTQLPPPRAAHPSARAGPRKNARLTRFGQQTRMHAIFKPLRHAIRASNAESLPRRRRSFAFPSNLNHS